MGGEKVTVHKGNFKEIGHNKNTKILVYQKFLMGVRAWKPEIRCRQMGLWCSHSSCVVGSLLSVAGMARQISGVFFASPIMKPHMIKHKFNYFQRTLTSTITLGTRVSLMNLEGHKHSVHSRQETKGWYVTGNVVG